MLVHNFVHGRAISTPELLAQIITLCAFGCLPDPDCGPSFNQRLPETIQGEMELFFCYEHQFNVYFRETNHSYEFIPVFHCDDNEATEREKAIATLHPHLFTQEGSGRGMH